MRSQIKRVLDWWSTFLLSLMAGLGEEQAVVRLFTNHSDPVHLTMTMERNPQEIPAMWRFSIRFGAANQSVIIHRTTEIPDEELSSWRAAIDNIWRLWIESEDMKRALLTFDLEVKAASDRRREDRKVREGFPAPPP